MMRLRNFNEKQKGLKIYVTQQIYLQFQWILSPHNVHVYIPYAITTSQHFNVPLNDGIKLK